MKSYDIKNQDVDSVTIVLPIGNIKDKDKIFILLYFISLVFPLWFFYFKLAGDYYDYMYYKHNILGITAVLITFMFIFFCIYLCLKCEITLTKDANTICLKYILWGNKVKENIFSYSEIENLEITKNAVKGSVIEQIVVHLKNRKKLILYSSYSGADELKHLIQDFFENYDNSSFSQE